MGFDQAAVDSLFDQVVSNAMELGIFRSVNSHEPKSAPGDGLRCAIWVDEIIPLPQASGLNVTTGKVTLNVRIYGNMLTKPEDEIDPRLSTAATTLLSEYSGAFTLGETVRNIDLLGAFGAPLGARAGYMTIDSHMYRVMTITLPVVVNDMWDQVA